ncbi:hypothetical protein P691DRAFT_803980 [Macrolepiota fuliginosa MF-IS2]|uniref:Uncharacterized protein n=1 Tax=Macrolepiota fuliginosa MF-IS2 TaxID=1400762 RepID=A0A9P5XAI5_9AGAR|nr:hypothetical protein P691DRAFT_803980 [Macrolepiota fuliginosa MF-IS2]
MSSSNDTSGVQFNTVSSPVDEKRDNGSPTGTAAVPSLPYHPDEPKSVISRRTRIIFYLRFLLFVFIELAFIALAAVCLAKPVPLNITLRLSDSEVKGGFTVIFIVWQSLAIIAGGYILADAFSREWSVQLAQIVPGTTDRVSTVTSGFLDRILYFFTKRASGTFKLAFLASLSFMALTQLAPGTISAATTLIDVPMVVNIGNPISLVATTELTQDILSATNRANLIVRLEQVEHSPFGLKLPPNRLVALPSVNLTDLHNGTLEYDSDVVEFHSDCHWEAPSFVNVTGVGPLAVAAGQEWSNTFVFGTGLAASSISSLALTSNQVTENISTIATLFIGGNGTFHKNPPLSPTSFAIDLGTLPSTFISAGVGVTIGGQPFVGPLASVLVCEPHPDISGGRVQLSSDGTISIIDSGRPATGNILPSAVNLMFTNALQSALISIEPLEQLNGVNNVASIMFMANSSVDWNSAQNIPTLDIATINKNMDTFLLSAAKAFLDGYRKTGTSPTPTFDLTPVPAIGQEQRLALTSSKGLFITTIVVSAISMGLLFALCQATLSLKRYPFDLHSVFTVLQEDNGRRASIYVPHQRSESV